MSGNHKSEQLANEILRQIMRMDNLRVLRAQPLFAVDMDMPAKFNTLLEEVESAERRQSGRSH